MAFPRLELITCPLALGPPGMLPRSVISKALTMLTEPVGFPINKVNIFTPRLLGIRSRASLGRVIGVTLVLSSCLQLLSLLLGMTKALILLCFPDLITLLI